MTHFSLPASYYEQPEPHETVIEVTADDELSCGLTGDVDAYTWDGETYEFSCECDAERHTVVREQDEPDYEPDYDEPDYYDEP